MKAEHVFRVVMFDDGRVSASQLAGPGSVYVRRGRSFSEAVGEPGSVLCAACNFDAAALWMRDLIIPPVPAGPGEKDGEILASGQRVARPVCRCAEADKTLEFQVPADALAGDVFDVPIRRLEPDAGDLLVVHLYRGHEDPTCPKCGGSGGGDEPHLECDLCHGSGEIGVAVDEALETPACTCPDWRAGPYSGCPIHGEGSKHYAASVDDPVEATAGSETRRTDCTCSKTADPLSFGVVDPECPIHGVADEVERAERERYPTAEQLERERRR